MSTSRTSSLLAILPNIIGLSRYRVHYLQARRRFCQELLADLPIKTMSYSSKGKGGHTVESPQVGKKAAPALPCFMLLSHTALSIHDWLLFLNVIHSYVGSSRSLRVVGEMDVQMA